MSAQRGGRGRGGAPRYQDPLQHAEGESRQQNQRAPAPQQQPRQQRQGQQQQQQPRQQQQQPHREHPQQPGSQQAQQQQAPNERKRQRPSRDRGAQSQPTTAAAPVAPQQVEAAHHEVHQHHHALSPEAKSSSRFADLNVSALTKQALAEGFRYETMTTIQSLAIPVALKGTNVLAKARTGTGKTLAFLIPCIERLAARRVHDGLGALVISPTRELAQQIADDVAVFLDFHRSLSSVTVYGGTNIRTDQRQLDRPSVSIVVATPGRLIDHLENTNGFARKISQLSMLVLDEADQCLDMGFRPSILKILSFLPTAGTYQTMLFSATIPKDLVQLAPQILGASFEMVDAVSGTACTTTASANTKPNAAASAAPAAVLQADNPFQTVAAVKQEYVVVRDAAAQIPALYHILETERRNLPEDHKIIVFFVTARLTQLFAELFNAMKIPTLEIHSRQSQGARQRASDAFHDGKGVTMFSSDVTARGMDYPDVSLVVQVGIPSNAEQYIHRLGRTARAGKGGRGVLILMQDETLFLRQVQNLPLKDATSTLPPPSAEVNARLVRGMSLLGPEIKGQGYAAWLGYYNSSKVQWTKERLVAAANEFAMTAFYLSSPPAIPKKTIGKMGLKGVKGLVAEVEPQQARGGQQQQQHQPRRY